MDQNLKHRLIENDQDHSTTAIKSDDTNDRPSVLSSELKYPTKLDSGDLGEVTYEEERKSKRISNLKTMMTLLKGGFGLGYFTLQEAIGEAGLILSAIGIFMTVLFVGYGIWRTCSLANHVEDIHNNEEGLTEDDKPKRIRTYEDLCKYTRFSNSMIIFTVIACFMINIANIVVFIVNFSIFFREFIPVPLILIKICIGVLTIVPFTFFQVPEDLRFFSIPSLIFFNLVTVAHFGFNSYKIASGSPISYELFHIQKLVSVFTVSSYQIEMLGFIFNIRNSMQNNKSMKCLGPTSISLIMTAKIIGSFSYVLVSLLFFRFFFFNSNF